MTIVTPIDGQPALAEHVAQLTESLTGVRAEPITLRGNLLVNGATYDLGATAARWRKLWAADGEFTNAPTVGGVALPTAAGIAAAYLPLAGGSVMTGLLGPTVTNTNDLGTTALKWRSAYLGTVLSVAGASATANQVTHAITTDAQPRLIIDGNGKHSWGPGASTAQDTTLERVGAGLLRAETSLGIGGTPPVTHAARRGLLVGDAAYIMGGTAYNGAEYRVNSYQDASNVTRAITANAGGSLALVNDTLTYANAPSVGAGAAQTMTARLAINASGNVALTPAASTAAISIGGTAQPKITVASGAPSSPMTGDVWFW